MIYNYDEMIEANGNEEFCDERVEFFKNLKKYIDSLGEAIYFVEGVEAKEAHIWFGAVQKGARVSVRVNKVNGVYALDDICLFVSNDEDKDIINKIYKFNNQIVDKLGYGVVYDTNQGKSATRISRFGKYSNKPNKISENYYNADGYKYYTFSNSKENVYYIDNNNGRDSILNYRFDFDLDVEEVATEMIKFYDAFIPLIKNNI